MRVCLRGPLLSEDTLPDAGPLFANTPTFQAIHIARMPPAYQLKYHEGFTASAPNESAPAASSIAVSSSALRSVAAAGATDATDGAVARNPRQPIVSNGALVIGALGTALAATHFLRN